MSDVSFRPLNLGDTADDDAQVLDSLVEQAPEPPTPPVGPIAAVPLTPEKLPTRLLSVRQSVDPSWTTPTTLFPADARRKFLTLRVTSPGGTATDGVVLVSSMRGSTTGLGVLAHGQTLPLDSHTGPVMVLPASTTGGTSSAPIVVDAWSVTE